MPYITVILLFYILRGCRPCMPTIKCNSNILTIKRNIDDVIIASMSLWINRKVWAVNGLFDKQGIQIIRLPFPCCLIYPSAHMNSHHSVCHGSTHKRTYHSRENNPPASYTLRYSTLVIGNSNWSRPRQRYSMILMKESSWSKKGTLCFLFWAFFLESLLIDNVTHTAYSTDCLLVLFSNANSVFMKIDKNCEKVSFICHCNIHRNLIYVRYKATL